MDATTVMQAAKFVTKAVTYTSVRTTVKQATRFYLPNANSSTVNKVLFGIGRAAISGYITDKVCSNTFTKIDAFCDAVAVHYIHATGHKTKEEVEAEQKEKESTNDSTEEATVSATAA